jgi:F-type H+-transporting ATPase subunit delta
MTQLEQAPVGPSHVLADPSAQAVAKVYAISYLDAAQQNGVGEPIEELESFVQEALGSSREFTNLLTSSLTSVDQKSGIIDRVVRPRATEFFTNFLHVLTRHGRLDVLPLIAREARAEHEIRTNQKRVTVKSAVPLGDEQIREVTERLKSTFGFQPILDLKTDPSLLGGLVVQIGDTVYDGSLRTRLRTLKQRLRERYLNEIQSGRNRFSIDG